MTVSSYYGLAHLSPILPNILFFRFSCFDVGYPMLKTLGVSRAFSGRIKTQNVVPHVSHPN